MPGPEENGIGFINAWNRHRSGARPALNWPGPMYVCMHIYIYIYIYIERERDIYIYIGASRKCERPAPGFLRLSIAIITNSYYY